MPHTALLITDDAFELVLDTEAVGPRRLLDDAAATALRDFAARYAALARARRDDAPLLALGRELHRWLDGEGGWLGALRARAPRPWVFEIQGPPAPTDNEWALLHAPWELLADADGFLARDALLQLCLARRLGRPAPGAAPGPYRLGLGFMAAAPRGQPVALDYEAEESAILRAVGDAGIDLVVEESGDPRQLGERLAGLAHMSALHLSCHGLNAWRPARHPEAAPRPVLLLEDAEGQPRPTEAGTLLEALGAAAPRLLFLSACLSARPGDAPAGPPSGPGEKRAEGAPEVAELAHSLATALVAGGVAAVVGWDGSVDDAAATALAQAF